MFQQAQMGQLLSVRRPDEIQADVAFDRSAGRNGKHAIIGNRRATFAGDAQAVVVDPFQANALRATRFVVEVIGCEQVLRIEPDPAAKVGDHNLCRGDRRRGHQDGDESQARNCRMGHAVYRRVVAMPSGPPASARRPSRVHRVAPWWAQMARWSASPPRRASMC